MSDDTETALLLYVCADKFSGPKCGCSCFAEHERQRALRTLAENNNQLAARLGALEEAMFEDKPQKKGSGKRGLSEVAKLRRIAVCARAIYDGNGDGSSDIFPGNNEGGHRRAAMLGRALEDWDGAKRRWKEE